MGRLQGKIAVVTGAGSGIGQEAARAFAREGATVGILDRNAPAVEATVAEIGEAVFPLVADVSDEASVAAAFDEVRRRHGRLDVLYTCAAVQLIGEDAPVHELDIDVWDRTHDVNLRGVFLCLRAALRRLLAQGDGGSIVTIGSVTGLVGAAPDYAAYTASKGGVIAITRGLAVQYGADGIRLNTICPGPIETPLIRSMLEDEATRRWLVNKVPLGRLGRPEEIAAMAVWLLSDEASFATGGIFVVDGGLTAV